MLQALKGMQNDKSPDLDGLPVEFYKFFWQDIKIISKATKLFQKLQNSNLNTCS